RGLPVFGNHANVVLVPLIPFCWLGAGPIFLLIVQVAAQASGAVAAYLLAREKPGDRALALLPAAPLLPHPPSQHLTWDFFPPDPRRPPAPPVPGGAGPPPPLGLVRRRRRHRHSLQGGRRPRHRRPRRPHLPPRPPRPQAGPHHRRRQPGVVPHRHPADHPC